MIMFSRSVGSMVCWLLIYHGPPGPSVPRVPLFALCLRSKRPMEAVGFAFVKMGFNVRHQKHYYQLDHQPKLSNLKLILAQFPLCHENCV